MLDLLLAAIAATAIVAAAVALLSLVTLLPFVLALQMADVRAFSTARWGAVSLASSLLGLLLALAFFRSDAVPDVLALLPLGLTWLAPGALWLLTGSEDAIGGRAGLHE